MRLFIAIPLPPHIKQYLNQIINSFKKYDLDANFVKADNLHITLKFLGEVSVEKIPLIEKILNETSKKFSSIAINLTQFGFFPNEKKREYFLCLQIMNQF